LAARRAAGSDAMRIAILIGGVAVIVVIALVVMKYRSGRGQRILSVTLVSQGAAGSWRASLPGDALVLARMMLVLLWGSKLRWLLITEPPEVGEAYRLLFHDLTTAMDEGRASSVIPRLRGAQLAMEAVGLGGTPPGTELVVSLFYAPMGKLKWMLNNNLPSETTHADLLWSLASLLDKAMEGMAPENRESLAWAFGELETVLYETPPAESLAGLQWYFAAANGIGLAAGLRSLQQPRQ